MGHEMGILDWLFGGDAGDDTAPEEREMVEYVDPEGREIRVPRETYRDEVLPEHLERAWDDPEALYQTVRRAIDDGFAEQTLEAARHLREIDPNRERGATMLGLTLWRLDRLEEAEEVYRDCIESQGESSVLLTNLAKLHAARDEDDRARETLWRALELDPNLENAVDSWASHAVEQAEDLDASYREALEEVAELPDAWYARVNLTRFFFEKGDDEHALEIAEEVAEIGPREAGALMDITGQLGRQGYAGEMLDWYVDLFDPSVHRARTGLNLIRACLETGRTDLGERLCGLLAETEDPHVQKALEEARESLDVG